MEPKQSANNSKKNTFYDLAFSLSGFGVWHTVYGADQKGAFTLLIASLRVSRFVLLFLASS